MKTLSEYFWLLGEELFTDDVDITLYGITLNLAMVVTMAYMFLNA